MLDKIIVHTVKNKNTLACPLCPHEVDVPAIQATSESLAAVFGISADTLDRMNVDRAVAEASSKMRKHLETHDVTEWLERIRA